MKRFNGDEAKRYTSQCFLRVINYRERCISKNLTRFQNRSTEHNVIGRKQKQKKNPTLCENRLIKSLRHEFQLKPNDHHYLVKFSGIFFSIYVYICTYACSLILLNFSAVFFMNIIKLALPMYFRKHCLFFFLTFRDWTVFRMQSTVKFCFILIIYVCTYICN